MKENWKNYYHKGLAAFFTVAMCILFYFVVFRFYEVKRYANMIMGILRPFAFGAVIAYLLRCATGLSASWRSCPDWRSGRRRRRRSFGGCSRA